MIGLRALLLLALPLGAAADGRPLQDPESISESVTDTTLINLGDLDSRLTVKVAVGSSGPYNFIIDTGAERTVVSRELAGTLQLAPGMPVNLTSMTGRSSVDTVIVPELFIQSIGQRHTITAPALYARNLGAAGLLGIDTLSKHQISIDFETETMSVRPSERRSRTARRSSDEIVVTAKSKFGQLIVTDAYYAGSRIQVVLDTGSVVSMGNNALRRLVGARLRQKNMQQIHLTSVTGGQMTADYTLVPRIKIGNIEFDTLPVAFAEVAPFKRFGLTRRPALLLGMDALRSFRHVDIDFPNRQVRFLMPRNATLRNPTAAGSTVVRD
ncbi:MAG: aspartyl protease family protein [Pseudomonadota bacterium]